MSFQVKLNDEIKEQLEELSDMEVGSEVYKTTVDGLTKLMDRAIEMQKLDQDAYDKTKDLEADIRIKSEQLEEEKRSRFINNIITGGGILLSTGVTIWGTMKSLKFEENGTVTTIMGRGFIQKLLPKK